MGQTAHLHCELCGQEHGSIRLKPGEKALCTRCGALLAKAPRLGGDAALVFALTGLIVALPAMLLPFVSAGKLGQERTSVLFTSVTSLWNQGMQALACLVFICGGLLPVIFLLAVAVVHVSARFGGPAASRQFLVRAARRLGEWAIPEVQVLAVLVAFLKLSKVVDVTVGPGFWCYCVLTVSLLVAQRSFDYDSTGPLAATGEREAEFPR